MYITYNNNRVTQDALSEIKKVINKFPETISLKYWYKTSGLEELYKYQQSGYHKFYRGNIGLRYCTCGLVVERGNSVEQTFGHRNLPSFDGTTPIFINFMEHQSESDSEVFGAYCQECKTESSRDFTKDGIEIWIQEHKRICLKTLDTTRYMPNA